MIFVQSLSVLTITFYDPLRYVHAMRFTSMRAVGLMFGLAGYATVFGTARPTLASVRKSLHEVMDQRDRGESVALAAYDESGTPTHWVFVGNTVD
jgi:hypothetical protein